MPTIPIIETQTVWCINSDVNFRCGYSLDFTQQGSFSLSEYTPVIEFYRRYNTESELYAFSLLPLSSKESVECEGKPLTFLYRNQSIDLKSIHNGQNVGIITVTVALGFPENQKYIDPDFGRPILDESKSNEKPATDKQIKKSTRKHHKHSKSQHKHRSRHKKHSSWSLKAIANGWNPPSYVSSDWKEKAVSKGWKPPTSNIHSSIGVECIVNEQKNVSIKCIQTEFHKIFDVEENQQNKTNIDDLENEIDEEDEIMQLIHLMNPNKNKNKIKKQDDSISSSESLPKQLSLSSPKCLFSNYEEDIKLTKTPIITLFDVQAIEISDTTDLSEISSSIENIDDLVNQSFPSKASSDSNVSEIDDLSEPNIHILENFKLSETEEESEKTKSIESVLESSKKLISDTKISDSITIEDEESEESSSFDADEIVKRFGNFDDPELKHLFSVFMGKE
ncbi:hypothetical protein GPJ56_010790 [Histomonas meleagridis]|uniref:uncharacterized protein n=1 Tax=Histomonas meleagridis TaxID=135588 RepID=UPI00355A313F|nr:hypothetical protein GPJ56_010790 [Histomonas meleagridis]KAH0801127.1 hypothetical protein GO595_006162 [Histomonas meleagridis]